MTPDLTDLQLISLGIGIAIATTFTTVLILTLIYAEEICRHLQRLGLLRGRRLPRTNFANAPFPTHYVIPCFEQQRPTIRTDLASVSTTTTTHSLHQRTFTIRSTSSNKYFLSQEDLLTRNDTTRSNERHRSPAAEPEDPGTSVWHIRAAEAADPWGDATLANPDNDPNYPAGSWNPGDRERALAQNAREALAIPRTRNGYHSPAYDVHDPFAPLRRNYIPFPTSRRGRIPPVPFGQWPNESDTSDSSDEPNEYNEQRREANAASASLVESIPRLDHSGPTDPFNAEGPNFEWNKLEQID